MNVEVQCIKGFFDMETGIHRMIGDIWATKKPRADILIKNKLVIAL